jgi:aspartate racemase
MLVGMDAHVSQPPPAPGFPSGVSPKLGVLGGMGPLATADFMAKLVAATPAQRDEDHLPVVIWSVPQIPPRIEAIRGAGASPLPAMLEGLRGLRGCGATLAAIACNTAHYWYDALRGGAGMPIVHIAEAASAALATGAPQASRIALLATRGTHDAGFYAPRLSARGLQPLAFDETLQAQWIDPAIAAVKANRLPEAATLLARAIERTQAQGAQAVLLACTELPVAFTAIGHALPLPVIDATEALAQACVREWRLRHPVTADAAATN